MIIIVMKDFLLSYLKWGGNMRKSLLLSISNIKVSKGQTISFLLMIIISSMLLNLGIVTYVNSSKNFDIQSDSANVEDCMISIQNQGYDDNLLKDIKNNPSISDYELRNVLLLNVVFKYNDGEQAIRGIFLNKDNKEIYNKTKITETSSKKYKKPIYLPLLLKTGGGYNIGDKFSFSSDGISHEYTVAGFFYNISLGTTAVPNIGFLLEESDFENLSTELNGFADAKMFLLKLKDRNDARTIISNLYNKYSQKSPNAISTRTYYEGIKQSRTFMSNIVATIVVAFSLIIVFVSLIIVRFRISNSIDEDMQGIGILKACGYTSNNIILSYILQFLLISLLGSIIGIGVSYGLIPILSKALEAQSGMAFIANFSLGILLISLSVILLVTIITVYLSTRRIKKIPSIIALKSGAKIHNFKKNVFPLYKTKGNINFVIGLKTYFNNLRHNITTSIIIALVTFTSIFVAILHYNIIIEDTAFVDAIAGEVPTVAVYLSPNNYDPKIKDELLKDSRVKSALYYDNLTIYTENNALFYYVADDFSKLKTNICYEGRYPIHDNEVAINGSLSNDLNKKIGDEVKLSLGDKSETYIITGFIQTANNMGNDAEITTEGVQRLQSTFKNNTIYLDLYNLSDADSFIDYVENTYLCKVTNTFCVEKLVNAQLKIYIDITKILIYSIIISSLLIITLMLYLIIKTMIIRNQIQYGIQKALGYTSKQLMIQLSLNFLITATIGSIVGGVIGYFATNTLFSTLLRNIGIMKIHLFIKISTVIPICALIVIFSYIISLIISRKVRKISAIDLIKE